MRQSCNKQGFASYNAIRLMMALAASFLIGSGFQTATAFAGSCPNEAFRSGFGSSLPDCRAYEQVTPTDKKGAIAAGIPDHLVSAEQGPGVTFFSPNGTSVPSTGIGSTGDYPTLLGRRGAESWSSRSVLTPQVLGVKSQFLGVTPDLRYDLVQALNTDYGHPGFGLGLYLVDTAAETNTVTTIVPAPANEGELSYAFDGASQDGSKVFFETAASLTPEAHGEDNLYMWNRATGEVSLVGLLPKAEGGEPPAQGSFGGAYRWFRGEPGEGEEPSVGGALGQNAVGALHAISPDGDQIYFTAAGTGQLYLRFGLNSASPTTIRVSEPNAGFIDSVPPKPAAFQEATSGGSRAFFLSAGKLAAGASTGPSEGGKDLYRFDKTAPAGERLIDLTPDLASEASNGARVQGLLGVSSNGDAGYFVARGELPVEAQAGSQIPQEGAENLYRFFEVGSQIRYDFVGILKDESESENLPRDQFNWSPRTFGGTGNTFYEPRASRVSSDGNILVFASQEPLTGYAPIGANCSTPNGVGGPDFRCSQIFRFDATSNNLTCISCSSNGEMPLGAATFASRLAFSKPLQVPEVLASVTSSNNVSRDGDRVFFQTSQPLLTSDSNGSSGCARQFFATSTPEFNCQDVYEWEAPGTPGGSCERAEVNGGCLYLISSGQSSEPSFFAGASADGSNVYILTTSSLVASDGDKASDVYDASVEGGIAAQQSKSIASCKAEGCLGTVSPAPSANVPGSSLIQGPGNKKPSHQKKKPKKHKGHHKKRHKPHKSAKNSEPGRETAKQRNSERGSRRSSGRAGANR